MKTEVEQTVTLQEGGLEDVPLGFAVNWIDVDGTNDFERANMSAGAGCGSALLTMSVTWPDGTSEYGVLDVRELMTSWLDRKIDEHKTKERTDGRE